MNNEQRNIKKEEKCFMEFAEQLEQWIQQPKVYILNKTKEVKMYEMQQEMQQILDAENIEAKVEIHPCPLGMGDIILRFQADSFIVRNTDQFSRLVKGFDNFEIYSSENEIVFAGIIRNVAQVLY